MFLSVNLCIPNVALCLFLQVQMNFIARNIHILRVWYNSGITTLRISLPFMLNGGKISAQLPQLSFQPVLHDWCNKGCGMCYPVCGMVHIKEPLLLIDKSSLCRGSGFPFSLSEWSLTTCLMPYNRR